MGESCITYENDLEQHLLVNLHELLVPLLNVGGLLAGIGIIIGSGGGVVLVMLAPFDNLLENGLVDLRVVVSNLIISKVRLSLRSLCLRWGWGRQW